jgi:hypothetical protein
LSIIFILVAAKILVLTVTGAIFWAVLGPEFRRRAKPNGKGLMPGVRCIYCHYSPALFHTEEQHWDGDDLLLTRTFECRRCHLPFWKVERVKAVRETAIR